MQRGLVSFLSVVFLVLLSSSSSALVSAQQTCGYGGVDLSSLASTDLLLTQGGNSWALRPCGRVSTAGYCGAQFCQGVTNVSYWSATGDYSGTGTDNTPQWAYTTYNGQPGIVQVLQDGTDCGGYGARQGTIEFICSASATTPQFSTVTEPQTCHYQAIVYTSLVCGITTAQTRAVGAAVLSNTCGGGLYNLNSLTSADLVATQSNANFVNQHYIRVCGVVSSTNLCQANNSMAASICQVDPSGSGTGNTIAVYSPVTNPTIYINTGTGLSQLIQDGTRCGGAEEERWSNITFVCSASATTPIATFVNESPTCHYNYQVLTSAVCGAAYASAVTQPCGYGPYDLTSLSTQDLLLTQTGNNWAIRVCGNVQTAGYCGAQFCQGTTNVSYWNPVGDYSSTGTDNSPMWAYTSYLGSQGVAQILQDGSMCGTLGARQGTIEFICSATATTPVFANVIETATCHYQAVVYTSLVCGASTAQLQATGAATISTQCGGGIYDISPLSNTDLVVTANNQQYTIRMCGTVSASQQCPQNISAQVCQGAPGSTDLGVAASVYQPYAYPTVWQYNGNGISQFVQDGMACGGEERMSNITLVCNPAYTTPVAVSATEGPTCHYQITILTSLVCGAPFAAAIAPPTTSTACSYGPYNLNSISGKDIITYMNGYWWAIRPCGTVQTGGFCAGQFCQGGNVISFWNGTNVANYQSTGTDNVPMWASVTFGNQSGVAQISQDGASCGGNVGAREANLYFVCNSTATTPYISYINEVVACHYTAVIQTSVVCGVRQSALQVPGAAFISNQCGGTVYNLTALASSDILGIGGGSPGSNQTAYQYAINLCGNQRTTSQCVNASVCQTDRTSLAGYPLSTWNPFAYPVVWQYNGNGVSQIVQDGNACGGEERLTNITLVCSTTATSPVFVSVVESPTCHYQITVQTNAVCGTPFSVAQPAGSCMWGGYDLSPITGQDLFWAGAGYNWAIRPCGTVQNTSYCTGQFCQGSTTVSYYNPTGDYSSTGGDNAPMWAYTSFLGQQGIAQIIQDGATCPGTIGARQGTIQFICNQTATTPYFANVVEGAACHYQAVIYTNLVCGITTALIQSVGSTVISTQCGGGIYDLSSLSSSDLVVQGQGQQYTIRVCGQVSVSQQCPQNISAQVCQGQPGSTALGLAVSVYQPYAYPTLWQYNGNGVSQLLQSGIQCGGATEERMSNITFVCNPNANPPIMVSASEGLQCHYNIVIQTSLVCGAAFAVTAPPAQQSCTYGSVDLSTVSSQDLLWYGNGYWWAIRPCGTVQTTGFCAGQFCQGLTTVSFFNGSALANYASTGTDNTPLWAYTTYNGANGIAQIIQDGASCGGNVGSRQGTILFICNSTATTAYVYSVSEVTTCHYQAIVYTSQVCGIASTALQTVGASVVSTQCGGGIYDLTGLAANDIVGGGGSSYTYYINVCGTVRNTQLCLQNNSVNASVCQVTASGTYGYPLSTYNPSNVPTLYTYIGNGVSQVIQDGFACGGEERLTNITFVCNTSSSTPYLSSATESPTCHYNLVVQTVAVCGQAFTNIPYSTGGGGGGGGGGSTTGSSGTPLPPSPSTGTSTAGGGGGGGGSSAGGAVVNSSSSSSLSGGAIAGIVIGSVVGVAILLALCFVVFVGANRAAKSDPKDAPATGRYGEMDHSQVETSQSGYDHGADHSGETGAESGEVEMQEN